MKERRTASPEFAFGETFHRYGNIRERRPVFCQGNPGRGRLSGYGNGPVGTSRSRGFPIFFHDSLAVYPPWSLHQYRTNAPGLITGSGTVDPKADAAKLFPPTGKDAKWHWIR